MKLIKGKKLLNQLYEAWLNWAPVLTWTTATPDGVTVLARYKVTGKTVLVNMLISMTDSNATTGFTCPLPIAPKVNNIYPTLSCVRTTTVSNTTITITHCYVRDDGVSNDLRCTSTALTDNTAYVIKISGRYEIN